MKRPLVLVLALVLMMSLFPSTSLAAGVKASDLTINAYIQPNGEVQVKHIVTVDFSGEAYSYLVPLTPNMNNITSVEELMPDGSTVLYKYASYGNDGWTGVWANDNPNSSDKPTEAVRIYADSKDQTRTFVINYTISGATRVYQDVGDFYSEFYKSRVAIDKMTINIYLPASTTINELKAWAHGGGQIRYAGPNWIEATYNNSVFAELRVAFPASIVNTFPSSESKLNAIIDEEKIYAENEVQATKLRQVIVVAAIIGFSAYFVIALWLIWKKRQSIKAKTSMDIVWRDKINLSAGAMARLSSQNTKYGEFLGTILMLQSKKFLKLREESETWIVEFLGVDISQLSLTERYLYEFLLKVNHGKECTLEQINNVLLLCNRPSGSSEPLTVTATFTFRTFAEKAEEELRLKDMLGRVSTNKIGFTVVGMLGMILLSPCLTWMYSTPMTLIALPVLVLIIYMVANRKAEGLTPLGYDAQAQVDGMRKFLNEMSASENSELNSLVLWEDYLIYAVTLGVFEKSLQELAARCAEYFGSVGHDNYPLATVFAQQTNAFTTFHEQIMRCVSMVYSGRDRGGLPRKERK